MGLPSGFRAQGGTCGRAHVHSRMTIAAFSSTAGRRTGPPGLTEAHKDRKLPSPCDGAAFCLLVRKEGLVAARTTLQEWLLAASPSPAAGAPGPHAWLRSTKTNA